MLMIMTTDTKIRTVLKQVCSNFVPEWLKVKLRLFSEETSAIAGDFVSAYRATICKRIGSRGCIKSTDLNLSWDTVSAAL